MGIDAVATFGFGILVAEENMIDGWYPWGEEYDSDFDEWVLDKYGHKEELDALYQAWKTARPGVEVERTGSLIADLQKAKQTRQEAFAIWTDRKKELLAEIGVTFEYGGSDGYQAGCVVVMNSAHRTLWSSVIEGPPDTSISATAEYMRIFQAFSEKVGLAEYGLGEPSWVHCAGIF